MKYAPVVIATLNRYEHLRDLIESLDRNSYARHTDLVISLDYPPNYSYEDGYKKNREYLHKLKNSSIFRKIILFEQDHNLGAFANSNFLMEYCIPRYDRWICTEDDNVFSANFLEYMDKGLEMFENDEDIYAISAICNELSSNHPQWEGNVFNQVMVGPYGIAFWRRKFLKMKANKKGCLLSKNNYSLRNMVELCRRSRFLFTYYVCQVLCDNDNEIWNNGELIEVDCVMDLYMYFNRLCCIFPVNHKGHNNGADGSGLHTFFADIDPDVEWPLDNSKSFEYILPDNFQISRESYIGIGRLLSISLSHIILIWIRYIIFRLIGGNTTKMMKFSNQYRKFKNIIKNGKS